MPASIRQVIAADKALIWANTKSIAYQIAMPDAVADHPEQWRDQGSPVIERGQHDEQQHPVSTITYQPRTSAPISNAQEVSRSAGH
jgi:hypothetical protein